MPSLNEAVASSSTGKEAEAVAAGVAEPLQPGVVYAIRQDLDAAAEGYLSAKAGTAVTILHAEDGWLFGRTASQDGWLPARAAVLPAETEARAAPSADASAPRVATASAEVLPGAICVLREGVTADGDGYLTAAEGALVTILHAEDRWFYGRRR